METQKGNEMSDGQITGTQEVQSDYFHCCHSKTFRDAPYTFLAIHISSAVILFMTDGLVGEYSGFVYSYAVEEPLSLAHKTAGYLPSLLWASITLGRLISIPA
ncbi:unnamed protein product, partial [Staurois parvus]